MRHLAHIPLGARLQVMRYNDKLDDYDLLAA